ncbi:MAG: S8 family peptidase, partial [Methylococcales bacterium]
MKTNRCNKMTLTAALSSILLVLACCNVVAMSQDDNQTLMISPKTNRLIIKYRDSETSKKRKRSSSSVLQSLSQASGTTLKYLHSTARKAHIVQLDQQVSMTEAKAIADQIAMDPDVLYAEPDGLNYAYSFPNDPLLRSQWHYFDPISGANLPRAWDVSTGKNVVVAVIDTGYRPHEDLQGKFLPGYDFISDAFMANDGDLRDSDARDPGDWMESGACGDGEPVFQQNSSWHGTHIAGTIAASGDNGIGVTGVAWNARILPVRAIGKCGGFTSDIAEAMLWAAGLPVPGIPSNPNPAKVINLSLGGVRNCPLIYRDAIQAVRRAGVTVVVAAGNHNQNARLSSPANCPGVIAVCATEDLGARSIYSNFGSTIDI